MPTKASYDYIVIGAGSAGCVVASRLTENPDTHLLLLEAGGPDTKPEIHDALAWGSLQNSEVDWQYSTEPEPHLHGRQLTVARGKVLGGTGSINGMLYMRASRQDYDHWNYLGNNGWSYEEVLPYFKKSEDFVGGANLYHGAGGPLKVNFMPELAPISKAFIEAAGQAGFGEGGWDHNGAQQAGGCGPLQLNINTNLQRNTSAVAFLRPAERRPNLTIATDCHVTRILLENNRAVGVEYLRDGELLQARAEREVILSAGAYDSPKLLMLSGIGPTEQLKAFDIPVIVDLPGVGQHLQDHFVAPVIFLSKQALPSDKRNQGTVAMYAYSNQSNPKFSPPDLLFILLNEISGPDGQRVPALMILVLLLRPQSRGSITLRSANPLQQASIHNNFLECQSDLEVLLDGIKIAREVAHSQALEGFTGEELMPGSNFQSKKELEEFVRQFGASAFHPTSSCKMGRDSMAVVDPELRVYGVAGLRVADASVMPDIVNSPPNATCIMIGEKAADFIKMAQVK